MVRFFLLGMNRSMSVLHFPFTQFTVFNVVNSHSPSLVTSWTPPPHLEAPCLRTVAFLLMHLPSPVVDRSSSQVARLPPLPPAIFHTTTRLNRAPQKSCTPSSSPPFAFLTPPAAGCDRPTHYKCFLAYLICSQKVFLLFQRSNKRSSVVLFIASRFSLLSKSVLPDHPCFCFCSLG